MSVPTAGLETDKSPPMAIPLRHFLVAMGFLWLAVLGWLAQSLDLVSLTARPALFHLLLVGWVCITIMGAMTQFIPVWSGVSLHSQWLAAGQLWLVAAGVLGLTTGLYLGATPALVGGGSLLALGLWIFCYNASRTLATVDTLDTTGRHFAMAIVAFAILPLLGLLLAVDLMNPILEDRQAILMAHATLAVFGAVLMTILGALDQLGPMFTQTDGGSVVRSLGRFEEIAFPLGVAGLVLGRLLEVPALARPGGVLIGLAVVAVGLTLCWRLATTQVPRTPMLSRYGVLAVAMMAWGGFASLGWATDATSRVTLLGLPDTQWLLLLGVIGFVVLGTLYHIVPFIIWVHQYSDRLGLEPVPMIDDLYSDRLAATDWSLFVAGLLALLASDLGLLARLPGFVLVLTGLGVFTANLVVVLRTHSPHSPVRLLVGWSTGG